MFVLDSWKLNAEAQIRLLGLPQETRSRQIKKFQNGAVLPEDELVSNHVEHLLGIAAALSTSYPANPGYGAIWVKQKNRKLRNHTPLDCMINDGLAGMVRVRSHLDCAWSWRVNDVSLCGS